jgi:uncharacterized membrane protein
VQTCIYLHIMGPAGGMGVKQRKNSIQRRCLLLLVLVCANSASSLAGHGRRLFSDRRSSRCATARHPCFAHRATRTTKGSSSISMRWQSISSSVVVDATPDEAYALYSQLPRFPEWSPWLKSVEYDPDPDCASASTKWVLASRGITVAWTAATVAAEPGSRIAWEATSGLPNRGEVIFSSLSPSGDGDGDGGGRSSVTRSSGRQCGTEVRLEVSYDAPKFITVLVKNVGVLSRFIEKTLLGDLRRFKQVLKQELEAANGTAEA